ncbi:E3 UFM1-protein ligase 1 [Trichinella pseudospiralis]|uniref:E3 UFM1-protein ligase 1 homolog n=1 Tax=Trichinella pseudospiralis TaxID=6337 RepID=A0A0V1JRB9_TRIPS|nr:E3 UFM1-protein ligase 1 [Trichinella pseudospiralis]KRZ37109.1 E3 UFM1-protein ligase 1 [Trichinella pseudospiralis]
MASWDEIKSLAADLRRVQLGESSKKLSQRNCIELITKLVESGMLEVITSVNRKDYITPEYLLTQIKNEVIANEGRVSLASLQQVLGVDFNIIEKQVNQLVANDENLSVCLGQIISKDYMNKVCIEIDKLLAKQGKLSVGDLAKKYDFPTAFLAEEIYRQIGKAIHGFVDSADSNIILTKTFVERQTAILRGVLSGCTRVISVKKLVTEFSVEPSLFFSCFDELRSRGYVRGVLYGGNQVERAVYMPEICAEKLKSHVLDFYRQNGYIELSYVKKFGVSDVSQFLTRLLTSENGCEPYKNLKESLLSEKLWLEFESLAKETMAQNLWLDVSAIAPDVLNDADICCLADMLEKGNKKWNRLEDLYFFDESLANSCLHLFDLLILEKADKEAPLYKKSLQQQHQKGASQSQEKARGKKKAAHVKGKKKKVGNDDEEDETSRSSVNTFMTAEQIVTVLKDSVTLENCPHCILEELSEILVSPLNAKYRARLDAVFLIAYDSHRKTRTDLSEKMNRLYSTIALSDLSLSVFDEKLTQQLRLHLLRGACTDLANLALGDYTDMPNPLEITKKLRDSAIQEMVSPAKEYFEALFASLSEKVTLQPFYDAMEKIALPNICGLNLYHPDRKMKTEMVNNRCNYLAEELKACSEPATALLLSCLLLFTLTTNQLLLASGKFVPQLISYLHDQLPSDTKELLLQAQEAVVSFLKSEQNEESKNAAMEIVHLLREKILTDMEEKVKLC